VEFGAGPGRPHHRDCPAVRHLQAGPPAVSRTPNGWRPSSTPAERPVQFIFAGKAHPKDNEGKGIIRSLVDFGRRTNLRHRFIFLEDYDYAHCPLHLVQGADVWLNTPRRPMEACGTSGMKAALNGVLNVSILDGWWCEGYSPERGWRIGNGEEYQDHNYQDAVESQALYNIIENEVAPLYYDRTAGGTPKAWLKMMKASMKMAMSQFCSLRMIIGVSRSASTFLPAAVSRNWWPMAARKPDSSANSTAAIWKNGRRFKWLHRRSAVPKALFGSTSPSR
jgi:glucan phosphorylase